MKNKRSNIANTNEEAINKAMRKAQKHVVFNGTERHIIRNAMIGLRDVAKEQGDSDWVQDIESIMAKLRHLKHGIIPNARDTLRL